MTVKIGIVGAGRIGKVHARNLKTRVAGAEVLIVADVFEDAARAVAEENGIPQFSADPADVFQHPGIDAVVVCSSTDTHAPFTMEAARHGKHVFCEKPIALETDVIHETLQVVEQAGVKLQVGFNRRFDANFARLKEIISSGGVGQPHLLHIISRDPSPPPVEYIRVSGGIFRDMTIHDFDMARFLMGSEVEEIYVAGAVLVDPAIGEAGDIDTAIVTLKFANGAMGTIDNSRQAVYGYDQRVEVFGSAGTARADNLYPNNVTVSNAEAVTGEKPLYFFMERYTESFVTEMNAFVDAVANDKPTPVTGVDGLIPVRMGLAAWKSYHENRPVRLDEID